MGYFKNRKCKNCGVEFEPRNTTQKFCNVCSIENKKKGNRERQKRWREKNRKNKGV